MASANCAGGMPSPTTALTVRALDLADSADEALFRRAHEEVRVPAGAGTDALAEAGVSMDDACAVANRLAIVERDVTGEVD